MEKKGIASWVIIAVVVVIVVAVAGIMLLVITPGVTAPKVFRFAFIHHGSPTDLSWEAVGRDATSHVKKLWGDDIEISEIDYVDYPEGERVIRSYAERGYDLVWAHSAGYEADVIKVAKDYPNVKFVVTAGTNKDPGPNVVPLNFKRQEGSYVLGALGALLTKTNKIASMSGMDFPVVVAHHNGYKLGAQSVNPDIEIRTLYAGTWIDPAKGREITEALVAEGFDVFWEQADLTGRGMLDVVKERGLKIFRTDYDSQWIAPEVIITTVLQRLDRAAEKIVGDIMNGTFKGGLWEPGIKEGVVEIAPLGAWEDKLSPAIKDRMAKLIEDIKNGVVTVPFITEKMD